MTIGSSFGYAKLFLFSYRIHMHTCLQTVYLISISYRMDEQLWSTACSIILLYSDQKCSPNCLLMCDIVETCWNTNCFKISVHWTAQLEISYSMLQWLLRTSLMEEKRRVFHVPGWIINFCYWLYFWWQCRMQSRSRRQRTVEWSLMSKCEYV